MIPRRCHLFMGKVTAFPLQVIVLTQSGQISGDLLKRL
jgi:hypothetical protein